MKNKKRNIIIGLCIAFASFLSFAYVNLSYQHNVADQILTIEESEPLELEEEIFIRDGETKILSVAIKLVASLLANKA